MEKYLQDVENAIEQVINEFERCKRECIKNVENMTVYQYEISKFGAIHCSKIEELTRLSTKFNTLQEQKNIIQYYIDKSNDN